MVDDLLHWHRLDRRGSSRRQQAAGLILLFLFLLSLAPLFECPCGGSPRIRVVSAPSDDVAHLGMISCPACRDTGRRSLLDRWFRDPPRPLSE